MTQQAQADSETPLARRIVNHVIATIPSNAPPDVIMWALVHWLRSQVQWKWSDPADWVDLARLLGEGEGNCRALSTALVALLLDAGYGDSLTWGVGFNADGDSHVWPIYWGPDGPVHLDASTWEVEPGQSPVDAPEGSLIASYSFPLLPSHP